jgi:hypothetical protein
MKNNTKYLAITIVLALGSSAALANDVTWTHWSSADSGTETALGTIGDVSITYTGDIDQYTTVNNSGSYLWTPGSTFTNSVVSVLPDVSDIIRLEGGPGNISTLTFSTPVTDLILDVTSIGSFSKDLVASYNFDHPFTILSEGGDSWDPSGSRTSLTMSGDDLIGEEGSGCILFSGVIDSLSWTTPVTDSDNGFTVGVLSPSTVPEPSSYALAGLGLVSMTILRRRK